MKYCPRTQIIPMSAVLTKFKSALRPLFAHPFRVLVEVMLGALFVYSAANWRCGVSGKHLQIHNKLKSDIIILGTAKTCQNTSNMRRNWKYIEWTLIVEFHKDLSGNRISTHWKCCPQAQVRLRFEDFCFCAQMVFFFFLNSFRD